MVMAISVSLHYRLLNGFELPHQNISLMFHTKSSHSLLANGTFFYRSVVLAERHAHSRILNWCRWLCRLHSSFFLSAQNEMHVPMPSMYRQWQWHCYQVQAVWGNSFAHSKQQRQPTNEQRAASIFHMRRILSSSCPLFHSVIRTLRTSTSSIHTAQSGATQTLRVMNANYVNVLYANAKESFVEMFRIFPVEFERLFVPSSSDTKTHLCTGDKLRRQMCTISRLVNKVLEI